MVHGIDAGALTTLGGSCELYEQRGMPREERERLYRSALKLLYLVGVGVHAHSASSLKRDVLSNREPYFESWSYSAMHCDEMSIDRGQPACIAFRSGSPNPCRRVSSRCHQYLRRRAAQPERSRTCRNGCYHPYLFGGRAETALRGGLCLCWGVTIDQQRKYRRLQSLLPHSQGHAAGTREHHPGRLAQTPVSVSRASAPQGFYGSGLESPIGPTRSSGLGSASSDPVSTPT